MFSSALATAFQIGPLTVHWYGVITCLAMVLGIWVGCREAKRQHLDPDCLLTMVLLLVPAGVIGARLYYVAMHWPYYSQNLGEIVAFWKGGLAIHGGILLAILVLLWYCRRRKLTFLRWMEVIVLGVILAQSIGRWGNYVNAELYGTVIEEGSRWSWIPFQVYAEGAYHHPTFLYESIWDFLGFVLLAVLIRRRHRVGFVFAVYLMFTSFGRFFIELLRTDMLMLFGVRQCYITCPLMFLAGICLLIAIRKQRKVDVTKLPYEPKGAKEKAHAKNAKRR